MISSSVISSTDMLEMLGLMLEAVEEKDVFGQPVKKPYSPVGEGFSNPRVCELKITDLSYLKMKAENLLSLDGQFAFVLSNDANETIVWPILSKTVYVFSENPFRLKSCKWYNSMRIAIPILTKEREIGKDGRLNGDPVITQHDKVYRVFKVKSSKIIAKQDYVESILRWQNRDFTESCTRHYPPMWLLRNEPEELKPQPRPLDPVHPILGKPYMGEIDE